MQAAIYCIAYHYPDDETSGRIYRALHQRIIGKNLDLGVYRTAEVNPINDVVVGYSIIIVGTPPTRETVELIVSYLKTDAIGTPFMPDRLQVLLLFARWLDGLQSGRKRIKHYPNLSGPRIPSGY